MDTESPQSRLKRNGLVLVPALAEYVCSEHNCVQYVSKGQQFRRHLRNKHGLSDQAAAELYNIAFDYHKVVNPVRSESFHAYQNGTSLPDQKLAKITGLHVRLGQYCSDCSLTLLKGNNFVQHRRVVHADPSPVKTQRNALLVPCQTLGTKNKKTLYFRVEGPLPSQFSSLPAETLPAHVHATSTVSKRLLKRRANMGGDEPDNLTDDQCDWVKSTFLSMSSADERLDSYGLTLSDAVDLSSPSLPSDSDAVSKCFKNLSTCFKGLFRDAQSLACDWKKFFHVRLDFATPGLHVKTRTFRFLTKDSSGDSSVSKYANRARIPIIIIIRLFLRATEFPQVRIAPELKAAISAYIEHCSHADSSPDPACTDYKRVLNRLVMALYFEKPTTPGSRS